MFLEKAAKYDLAKYFNKTRGDVRSRLKELYLRTRSTVATGRTLVHHPEFIDLVAEGKTHVSHIAIIAPKVTEANKDLFLAQLPGKSEQAVRELAAAINFDGSRKEVEPTFAIRLTLTASELELLKRSREVLSGSGHVPADEEVFVKAMGDLLAKRDPMQKAERATARTGKGGPALKKTGGEGQTESTLAASVPKGNGLEDAAGAAKTAGEAERQRRRPIPARVRHEVYRRAGGRCTFVGSDGRRCGSRVTLQLDHRIPVAFGGGNEVENIRLLCREHNIAEGVRQMGEGVMQKASRWSWNPHKAGTERP